MAKRVFTVGCRIPGDFGEYVEVDSKASLLDADFVLFCPDTNGLIERDLGAFRTRIGSTEYRGKRLLTEKWSFRLKETIDHWKRELNEALIAGKSIFFLSSELTEVFVETGEKKYSGTGRNRETTNIVNLISNYDVLPFDISVVESEGASMKLSLNAAILTEYWQQFGDESRYRVHMEPTSSLVSLVTAREGHRIVGSAFRHSDGGTLVLLPWIDLYKEEFYGEECEDEDGEEYLTWTLAAKEWGSRFLRSLTVLDKAIRTRDNNTPLPAWAEDDTLKTAKEIALSKELSAIQFEFSNLKGRCEEVKQEIAKEGTLKRLLFEQGRPLENAVLEAMTLIGFTANNYRDSDSEFDAVLECPEGRCIGEVEGKNNKAINIDKMRQLNSNIGEDLEREEVSEPAKAVLFGNAHRLTPLDQRPAEHFTSKCIREAQRIRAALVRTSDLFEVAKALADHANPDFATLCRKAILETEGEVVQFPSATNAVLSGRYT